MNRNLNSNFLSEVLPKNSWIKQCREYFRSLPRRIYTKSKKFLALLGAIIFLLLASFLGRLGKNYFSLPKPEEVKSPELAELEEEISSETSSLVEFSEEEVVLETNQSGLDPAVKAYYDQIITNIRSDNLHGAVIIPWLRSEWERTNNSPYWLCSVPTCQWTVGRKQCTHNCYLRCSESDCAFSELESYCYYDYCSQHTCQRCQQLVVIYEDNHGEKYCSGCLPKTVADYQTPNF